MLQRERQIKSFKKKIFYVLFLILLVFVSLFIYSNFIVKRQIYISPLGKGNLQAVNAENLLRESKIPFNNFISSDSSYQIALENNGWVKFSSQKDLKNQISSLQRILRELTIEGKPFKSIDFRFSEPIISF